MEIEKLIVKYLVGCLSKEEDQTLKKWLQEDESHQLFFHEVCSNKNFLAAYRQYNQGNLKSRKAFHKVWSTLHKDDVDSLKQRKIKLFHYWQRIACSLLILFLFVGEGYFFYDSSRIIPGESKAFLTLEDGSARQLKKSGQEHWIYIGNTPIAKEYDGMIVYHITNESPDITYQLNTLSVPRGGEYRLTLSDGTKIHLNSESELRYPVSFKGQENRMVELKGEAYFEIAKDSLHPLLLKNMMG